jgi:ABC-type transport system involved in multi-copper enzyme maturation permease subunit
MRAWEIMKETFWRKEYIWIVHVVWFAFYGAFWWLLAPDPEEFGNFVFNWGGFILPLALSAGVIGDDIASGRICVLVTRPFWLGKLYLYRLLGLSAQGAVHFALAGVLVFILHVITREGSVAGLGWWLLAAWLLFNTFAALSTSLSVVMKRAHNSLLLFVTTLTLGLVAAVLIHTVEGGVLEGTVKGFFRYPFPPFELLSGVGQGEYAEQSLTVAGVSVPKSVACVVHSLVLTALYGGIGVFLLGRRQFLTQRE